MKPEKVRKNVEAWCEALESGEFEQTTDSLHKRGAYCCLGVARCVLRGERGAWQGSDLKRDEAEQFGLTINGNKASSTSGFMRLNDGWRLTLDGQRETLDFRQIAEVIRREHPIFREKAER